MNTCAQTETRSAASMQALGAILKDRVFQALTLMLILLAAIDLTMPTGS